MPDPATAARASAPRSLRGVVPTWAAISSTGTVAAGIVSDAACFAFHINYSGTGLTISGFSDVLFADTLAAGEFEAPPEPTRGILPADHAGVAHQVSTPIMTDCQ